MKKFNLIKITQSNRHQIIASDIISEDLIRFAEEEISVFSSTQYAVVDENGAAVWPECQLV